MSNISEDTKAILLLTAPLLVGRPMVEDPNNKPLTPGEYKKLLASLQKQALTPAALIGTNPRSSLTIAAEIIDTSRLDTLLARGLKLGLALEHWTQRGIWVCCHLDKSYPSRLKDKLGNDAPPILYGCGSEALLDKGGLAVVGSRNIDSEQISFTHNVGQLAAEARMNIVSGGARGIDQTAVAGVLEHGGCAVAVLSDSLSKAVVSAGNRRALADNRLALISSVDPGAGFNVGNAMQRNKYIYALADAGLVVTAEAKKGGTWEGAAEQLKKYRFVPVYVRRSANEGDGNAGLIGLGARPWPDLKNGGGLINLLSGVEPPRTTADDTAAKQTSDRRCVTRIPTASIEKALLFYRDTLGLTIKKDRWPENVIFDEGIVLLPRDSCQDIPADFQPRSIIGFKVSDIADKYKKVKNGKVVKVYQPLSRWEHTEYLCFKVFDPDGNLVEVFSDTPVHGSSYEEGPVTCSMLVHESPHTYQLNEPDDVPVSLQVQQEDADSKIWQLLKSELQQSKSLKAIETLLKEKGLIKIKKEAKAVIEILLAKNKVVKLKKGGYQVATCDLFGGDPVEEDQRV